MKTNKLLEIAVVTDDETGNYRVGELDFGFNKNLEEYIKRGGRTAINELCNTFEQCVSEATRFAFPSGLHKRTDAELMLGFCDALTKLEKGGPK